MVIKTMENIAERYDEYREELHWFTEEDEALHGEPIHPFDRGRY